MFLARYCVGAHAFGRSGNELGEGGSTREQRLSFTMGGGDRGASQQGTALLLPLLVLMAIVSFFSLSNLSSSSVELALSGNYRTKTSAFYAAEAGIEHARRVIVNSPQAVLSLTPGETTGKIVATSGGLAQPLSLGGESSYRVFLQSRSGNVVTFRSIGEHDKAQTLIEYRAVVNPARSVKDALELYEGTPGAQGNWDLRWETSATSRYRMLIDGRDKLPPSVCSSGPCTGEGPNLPAIAATNAQGKTSADGEYNLYDDRYADAGKAGSCLSCDGGQAAGLVTHLGGTDKMGTSAIVQVTEDFNWETLAGQLEPQASRVISSDLQNVNQTWGSATTPEITLIDNARITDSTITGYGILLLKNDVRLKDAINFQWEGLVIIYGAASDFRCEIDASNTNVNIYGSVVLTGEDRRFDLDTGGKMNTYYSSQALANVESLFGAGGGMGRLGRLASGDELLSRGIAAAMYTANGHKLSVSPRSSRSSRRREVLMFLLRKV